MGQTKLRTNQVVSLNDGWIPIPDEYAIGGDSQGLDTITITNNDINYLTVGMRVKVVQGGTTYYGIIHKIQGDVVDSYIYIFCSVTSGTRNRLGTGDVTEFYYSRERCPVGFPNDEISWKIQTTDTTTRTRTISDNNWNEISSYCNLVIPLGKWKVGYYGIFQANNGDGLGWTTLGTTKDTSSSYINGFVSLVGTFRGCGREYYADVTAETTYYLNMKRNNTSTTQIGTFCPNGSVDVYAINAYL